MAVKKTRFFLALLIPMVLLGTTETLAWHEEDERENAKHGAVGGDPRVLDDMGTCREVTRNESGVTCAVLYAHILDLLNPAPLNTQFPAECAVDHASGFTGTPGVEPYWSFSRAEFFVNDGFIEHPETDQGECRDPQLIMYRQNGDDVHITGDAPIIAYWYLSADSLEFSPLDVGTGKESEIPSLGAMPCLTVRVTLETGRFPGAGENLTEGTTTKTVLSTPYGQGSNDLPVEDPCPDSEGMIAAQEVTEFQVELEPLAHSFEMAEPFVFSVQWYQHGGTSEDPGEEDNFVQKDWNLRSGSEHRNRFVVPVQQPLRVLDLRVLEGDERLSHDTIPGSPEETDDAPRADHQIHLLLRSSWGAYDIDEKNLRFHVVHEDGTTVPIEHIGTPQERGYHGHYTPRNLTFDWDPRAEGLAPGTYTLRAVVPNWQHTAEAQAETLFVIEEEAETQAELLPAPASPVLLGLLMLLLLRHRARRRVG